MNICELCGTANSELDTECRVCGHVLATPEAQPESVAVQHVSAHTTVDGQTSAAPEIRHSPDVPRNLQMSSVPEHAPTGTPPMLSSHDQQETEAIESVPRSPLPNFMQPGGRAHAGAQGTVELISANDLPSWIRQIAEADAAKEEAAAAQTGPSSDAPASLIKRALPGETRASGPPTSWLSKSATTQESAEHWAAEEIAAANWGPAETRAPDAAQPAYPTIAPATTHAPIPSDDVAKSKQRRKFGLPKLSESADIPVFRRRPVQLALLILLVVILAAMLM